MSILLHPLCSFILGFLFFFPCVGYAQKRVPAIKYVPERAAVRASRPFLFPAIPVPKEMILKPGHSARFVPITAALQRRCAHYGLAAGSSPFSGRFFPGKAEIDAVIFDLDGTLLDSLSAWEHSGSNFVRSQGIEPPQSLDDELVALSLLDGAKLLKDRYSLPQSPEEILALTLRPIEAHYANDILPMPGVPALLALLKAQGIKMAVATASDRALAEVSLKRLGLLDYFEFIITCDEVGVGKSSARVYEEALRRLGTAKARTLVAEDALHALQTAHAAGFPTAAIEEAHSAAQQAAKKEAATYYVRSYKGRNVFTK